MAFVDCNGDNETADEVICPLCTESLDVTDKSINFCKCGYQLCLWCWHQIMETAQKDNVIGRCPACRTPYDPDRITMEKVDPKEYVGKYLMPTRRTIARIMSYFSLLCSSAVLTRAAIPHNCAGPVSSVTHVHLRSIIPFSGSTSQT